MKKILALVLALCSIGLLTSTSFADVNFNADDYTKEELMEIYGIIAKKLNECIVVPAGYYVVGKDIPVGKYTILKNSELPGDDPDFSWVAIFDNEADYKKETSHWSWDSDESKCLQMCNTLWNGMTVELTEGQVLAVGFGTAGLKKADSGIFNSLWD